MLDLREFVLGEDVFDLGGEGLVRDPNEESGLVRFVCVYLYRADEAVYLGLGVL
jgi:hypothetical protein